MNIFKKFIDVIHLKNWEVESDVGWQPIDSINKTIEYDEYEVKTERKKQLICADNHILIDDEGNEIFAKDAAGRKIITKDGKELVTRVRKLNKKSNMYDLSLPAGSTHCYYTNKILSHNTTLLTIMILWYVMFNDDKTVLIISNKEDTSEEILQRIKLAYEEIPVFLKPAVVTWQGQTIKFENGSRIKISATSANSARGLSVNLLAVDECSIIDDFKADDFFKAVLPTISSSKKSKIILTSTPKGTNNYFYRVYQDAISGKSAWKAMSVPWYMIPGRDEEWRKMALSDCGGDEKLFLQEYCCEFLQDGDSTIDKDLLDELKSKSHKPTILNTEDYKVWEKPDRTHVYSIGVDVSDGVGSCASCIQVIDITDARDIRQVACYNDRYIDPQNFAKKIFEIAGQWGNPWIFIERNSMGTEVVAALEREPFYYPRLAAYDQKKKVDYSKRGIMSSTNVKYEGVTNMRYYMNTLRCVTIPDVSTINEFTTFIKKPNGTFGKTNGANIFDDRVMALCWALFALSVPLVNVCYAVSEYDENGKPMKVENNYMPDGKDLFKLPSIIFGQAPEAKKTKREMELRFPGYEFNDEDQDIYNMTIADLMDAGWRRVGI